MAIDNNRTLSNHHSNGAFPPKMLIYFFGSIQLGKQTFFSLELSHKFLSTRWTCKNNLSADKHTVYYGRQKALTSNQRLLLPVYGRQVYAQLNAFRHGSVCSCACCDNTLPVCTQDIVIRPADGTNGNLQNSNIIATCSGWNNFFLPLFLPSGPACKYRRLDATLPAHMCVNCSPNVCTVVVL